MTEYIDNSRMYYPFKLIHAVTAKSLNKKCLLYYKDFPLVSILMVLLSILYTISDKFDDEVVIFANSYLPMVFIAIMAWAFVNRIKSDSMLFWCPLTWFYLGSAISFGYGSLLWYYANEWTIIYAKTIYPVTDREILKTNILNVVSVVFILFGYAIGAKVLAKSVLQYKEINLIAFARLINVLVLIYVPSKIGTSIYVYTSSDALIPGFIQIFLKLDGLIIFSMFYLWGKGLMRYKYYGILFCLAEFLVAIPGFSKGEMLMPFLSGTLGYYWATNNIKVFIKGIILVSFLFKIIVSPLSLYGRTITMGHGAEVSYTERISIVANFFEEFIGSDSNSNTSDNQINGLQNFWVRNCFNNVQAYSINAYDHGSRGHSLDDFYIAMIPRFIWPEKPDITYIGVEFDILVKNLQNVKDIGSSLAPTFNGEAYWNGGWWMVGLVCTIIGIEFAQLAVMARNNLANGDLRYLLIAFFGITFGMGAEIWIVMKYVGAFLTINILWLIIKFVVPIRAVR